MKLIVLGATGATGLEIVRQALERGHSVTALARSPERLKLFGDRIRIKQGDLLNSADLEPVIRGHDAVISGFDRGCLSRRLTRIFSGSSLPRSQTRCCKRE